MHVRRCGIFGARGHSPIGGLSSSPSYPILHKYSIPCSFSCCRKAGVRTKTLKSLLPQFLQANFISDVPQIISFLRYPANQCPLKFCPLFHNLLRFYLHTVHKRQNPVVWREIKTYRGEYLSFYELFELFQHLYSIQHKSYTPYKI